MVIDFEKDIGWFIDRHFNRHDVQSVYDVLEPGVFRTARIARAVLFLSNGSLSLLRHYARVCAVDVGGVLVQAEYVAGVSEMPMQVRDMSLPFWHERNLDPRVARTPFVYAKLGGGGRTRDLKTTSHHAHLVDRRFTLGRTNYLVAKKQPSSRRVRCFRKERSRVTLVELPLAFVLEQVAERIEITDTAY